MFLLPLQERTVFGMWIETVKGMWNTAIEKHMFFLDREPSRCDYCGRRILDNDKCVARVAARSEFSHHVTFITTCLNHGDYDGQIVMDCFTTVNMTLMKERPFYHEMAVLHEAWFYVKAVGKFVRSFFRELPMGILCSLDLPLRKAIERQKERLGYK